MQARHHTDEPTDPLLPWPECCAPEGGIWIELAGRAALTGEGADNASRWFERLFGDRPVERD